MMNHQLLERIRDHATALDQVAPPIELDDVRGSTRYRRSPRPRHPLATAAAAALVVVGGLVAINAARRTDREPSVAPPSISALAQMSQPTEVVTESVGGLVIVDAGNDQSNANNTLERVDPDAENGPYVVVIRHRSGSLVDKTAVISYQPRTTRIGDQRLLTNESTGVSTLTVVRGADQVVVRALGLSADQVTAIADATQIVDGRLLVNQSPELADFVIVAAGPQRPPRIHEARYGCDSLGEADALGAFCYTGLTTSPGFEAAVYAGEFRPGPTINGHLTLVSAVGGGSCTLAWEPQPGVIAFVGYSGNNLGDQQIDALARIAQRVAIVPPDDWRATQPQTVTQSNEW